MLKQTKKWVFTFYVYLIFPSAVNSERKNQTAELVLWLVLVNGDMLMVLDKGESSHQSRSFIVCGGTEHTQWTTLCHTQSNAKYF